MPDPKTYTQDEFDAMVAERDAVKANRDVVLKEAKDAKKKLADYDGVDPEKYKQLESAAAEADRKKATAEGDFKSLETQLKDLHKKEIDGKEVKIGKLTKAVEKRAIRNELTAALIKAGALPDMIDLLVERGEKHGRLKETDDDYASFIADEKGNPLVADGAGTAMTWDVFVEQKLKTQYPRAFEGTGSSGGGAPKSNPGGGGSPKVIQAGDNAAFLANLDGIASGKVTVQ